MPDQPENEQDQEFPQRRITLLRMVLIMTPAGLIMAFILLNLLAFHIPWLRPLDMHTDPTSWHHVLSHVVDENDEQPAFLLLFIVNEPPGDDIGYNRLLCLSLDDGRTLGQHVDSGMLTLMGMDRKRVWVRRGWKAESALGLRMPALNADMPLEDLLEKQPKVRGIVKEVYLDGRDGLLHLEARDGYCYSLQPETGELKRMSRKHPPLKANLLHDRWKLPKLPAGLVPADHQVHFSIAHGELGLFVSGEREEPDDILVTAFDLKTGRVRWTRTFW